MNVQLTSGEEFFRGLIREPDGPGEHVIVIDILPHLKEGDSKS